MKRMGRIKMKRRVKNKVLTAISIIALVIYFVGVMCIGQDNILMLKLCIPSAIWWILFAVANKDTQIRR